MNSRLKITKDGSHTLYSEKHREHYHSTYGATQESKHIFIDAALNPKLHQKEIRILEVGTGTGLNVLLSFLHSKSKDCNIYYEGVELYPISKEEAGLLNYTELSGLDKDVLTKIHSQKNVIVEIGDNFHFLNRIEDVKDASFRSSYFNVVYFDAFSPESQPELWTTEIFAKIFNAMADGGVLTTYSCKGIVKRAMKSAGFVIEKLPGPPGKREFLLATK